VTAKPPHALNKLDRLWLAEAVRLTEAHAGQLEDADANRHARARGGDLEQLILTRAERLAERDGLRTALLHWRQAATLVLLALAVFAVFTGAGLAAAALGNGERPVNVFWALGSLLGLHLFTLIGWLLGFASGGGAGLGRLWLWLSGKLAHDARAVQLAPALLSLLSRAGLARWGLGLLANGFWLLITGTALLVLIAMLSTRRYGFSWETTLLTTDHIVALTQRLGALPALLGFPVPAPAVIEASSVALDQEAARQSWAGWLLGAMAVYGVLPRLLLTLLCGWRWRRGLRRLRLDLSLPEYQVLRTRLQPPGETLGVSDAAPDHLPQPPPVIAAGTGCGAVLVGIELDQDQPWPPPLPTGVADAGVVSSRQQRQALLEALIRQPPARLLIACDPRRSVDRGTLKLIAELAQLAAATRVWLVAAEGADPARREQWRAALRELRLECREEAPLTWLESGHD